MKLRKHISRVAVLVATVGCLSFGNHALGQALQPPFMAPTPPSLTYGAFYISAGAKYRNLYAFKMNVSGGPNSIVVDPGTVPFGPTTAGNFGVGTGRDGFLGGGTLTWTYDNGQINATPTPPGAHIITSTADCSITAGLDQVWGYSVIFPELGRYVTTSNNPDSSCSGLAIPLERGSFVIDDPATQVNNLASIAGTTTVTFSVALADSLAYTTNPIGAERVYEGAVVGPTFEMGYQWSNYFDLFYGFFWFNTSNSISQSTVVQGQGTRTTITDTFPFLSDDTSPWPIFSFRSSTSVVGTTPAFNYHIAPNSSANGGIFPNRQFATVADASIVPEDIQETLYTTAEFTPLENRFGARSWAPLWGIGRIGAILGGAIIPTYFKISGSLTDIAVGPVNGAVPPGTVLLQQVGEQNGWRTLYGGFVGGDLLLGNTGYFLYGSADYMWASSLNYDLGRVTTIFNPGGFTAGFSAGIQF
jgi:hypothetical protein